MSKLASILIFALVSSVTACDEKNHTVCDNKYNTTNTKNTTVPIIPTSTGGIVSSNQSICVGSSATDLNVTNNIGTIQWQTSLDSIQFNDLVNEKSSSLKIGVPSDTKFYRVKAVNNAVDSIDNLGNFKTSTFGGFLPAAGSGSFTGAAGSLAIAAGAKYYDAIKTGVANTQGLTGSDYTNMINLLGNADDYKYNVLITPGLFAAEAKIGASQVTTAIKNTQNRGDNVYVVDLVPYSSSINTVTGQANAKNTSYAAAYWPWVQTKYHILF